MSKFRPIDWIAILIVTGYIFLSWKGVTTMFSTAFVLVIGFYFGAEHQKMTNNLE